MTDTGIELLVIRLADAKSAEAAAKRAREAIEKELAAAIGVPDTWSGTLSSTIGAYKVTCARRENVKIDADMLRDIAAGSAEMDGWVKKVFRFKPEIAKKEWDAAPADVLKTLGAAVTRAPGKISFTLKNREE